MNQYDDELDEVDRSNLSNSRLFAISDLHGHWRELMSLMPTLINQAGLNPAEDTVVFLGDYVDGGPDTKRVIQTLMGWQLQYPHWQFLYANHEDLMLDALLYNGRIYGSYNLWWSQGGRETAKSYLPEDASDYERAIMQPLDYISQEHLHWLQERPLTYEQDGYLFVHAGIRPGIPLNEQEREDLLWIREEFIESMDDFGGRRVVFGHTPMQDPLVMPNKIGIDTMFHNVGKLTAVELNTTNIQDDPVFYFSPAVEGGS